jgi:hypothetical protein
MPNSKYKSPALRLIVTDTGAQYPAFPDGTQLPRVIFTCITQDSDQANIGMATLEIKMYVSPASEGRMVEFAKFQNGILKYGENQVELNTWQLQANDPDLTELYELTFTTQVYPDPTIPAAQPTI